MNGAKRGDLLNKFADLFEKNLDKTIELESLAMGIPVGSAKSFAHAIPAYFRCMSLSTFAWMEGFFTDFVQIMQDTQISWKVMYFHPKMVATTSCSMSHWVLLLAFVHGMLLICGLHT